MERGVAIDAPADRVWPFVADTSWWPRWNPVYPQAAGGTAVGDRISLTIALPGARPLQQAARVLVHEPDHRLHIGATVLGGLLRARRMIEVTPTAPGRCRVVNAEALGGLLGGVMMRMSGEAIGRGLALAGEGLKRLVEQGDAMRPA